MKANRKFVEEKEAVSAVIGVILMVAITVAIAATVYVYVSGMLGEGPEDTPNITFAKQGDTLQVSRADSGLLWSDFSVTSNVTVTSPAGTATVTAGDTLTPASTPCWIKVIHTGTNSLIGNWTLS